MTVQYGWPLGMPLVKYIGNGLWEIRSQLTHSIARVIFLVDKETIVLLHGFTKKTQQIPIQDLVLVKKRKALYLAN